MKIRWQKIAAGVYQTDSGRWRIALEEGIWYLFDMREPATPIAYSRTLRHMKRKVDAMLELEQEEATK